MNENIETTLSRIEKNSENTQIMLRYLMNSTIYNINKRAEEFRNPFNNYGKKMYSQTDEDGLTFEIVRRLGIKKGVFAEFGVGNGLENNTISLAALKWRGFWVGMEDLVVNINPTNERSLNFEYIKDFIDLDNILSLIDKGLSAISQQNIDLISLDLDGNDLYFVTKILENNIQPKIFIVEYNSKIIPPVEFTIDYNSKHTWNHTDYFGASLMSFYNTFSKHEYFPVCCNSFTGSNAFFVKNEFRSLFPEVPDDIDRIWCQPLYQYPPDYGHGTSQQTIELIFRNLQQDRSPFGTGN